VYAWSESIVVVGELGVVFVDVLESNKVVSWSFAGKENRGWICARLGGIMVSRVNSMSEL
jgi:hypothetical protein